MGLKETRTQFWRRRGGELGKKRKDDLCYLYRQLGGLGGAYPPEKWRKDEVVNAIVDIEWGRLPEDQKAPEPPLYDPPCGTCGAGYYPEHPDDHNYHYTAGEASEADWICRYCTQTRAEHTEAKCATAQKGMTL